MIGRRNDGKRRELPGQRALVVLEPERLGEHVEGGGVICSEVERIGRRQAGGQRREVDGRERRRVAHEKNGRRPRIRPRPLQSRRLQDGVDGVGALMTRPLRLQSLSILITSGFISQLLARFFVSRLHVEREGQRFAQKFVRKFEKTRSKFRN